MKKTTKKLLTLALSTLFIGAGVSSAAVWHNNAKLLASAADPNGNVAFDSYLKLEEAKIKKITDWCYTQDDEGNNIWNFNGPSGEEGNPEIRFVTDGTDTSVKVNGSYTFAPVSITGFSFEYRMENWDETIITGDNANVPCIVQILASDSTYPMFKPTIDFTAYEWATVSFDLTSECIWNGQAATLADVKDLFSGFVFKLGALDGTFDIRNIQVSLAEVAEPEPEQPAEKTFVDLKDVFIPETYYAWGQTGDYTEAPLYRFKTPDLTDPRWVESGAFGANDSLPATVLDNILVNGKSVSQHNAEYKALIESGAASPITWTGMPEDVGAPSGSGRYMQPNIAEDVKNGTARFAPIFVNVCTHAGGAYGNAIDMYIPESYLAPEDIYSIKFTTDFVVETATHKFGFAEDVEFLAGSIRRPVKQVGEAEYNIIPTEVSKIDGTNSRVDGSWDSFLRFYLTESDYTGLNTAGTPDKDFLKKINFFDYVLIDGEKMGSYWREADGSSSYPDEQFFNVWGKSNSFATRWPKVTLNNEAGAYGVQEIKILKGFQVPSATDFGNTLYEVQEDTTFVRMADGLFYNAKYTLNSNSVSVSEAKIYGAENELWEIELNFEYWALIDSGVNGHPGNANYFSNERVFGRQNILVNGESLWNINVNTDDSNYNYPTGDWTHADVDPSGAYPYQVHQNPARIVIPYSHEGAMGDQGQFVGEGVTGKVYLYLHTKYVDSIGGIGNVSITFNRGAYVYDAGADYVASETFTLEVPAPKYTVTVITGNPRMPGARTETEYVHGEAFSIADPVAEGKTFTKWTDAYGNDVTLPETVTESFAIYANWEVIPYTLTITKDGAEHASITFGAEYDFANGIEIAVTDLVYVLEDNLPVDESGEYVYAYENVPAEFALQDYTINAVGTKVKFWLTVTTGNPRMDPNCVTATLLAEGEEISVETPTAEGKTFTKWTDAYSVDVTVPATMPAEDIAIYANWAVTPYTLTIVNGDNTTEIIFGVEYDFANGINIAVTDLVYVLEDNLPAATEDYTYAYAEAIPAEFALENYTFNVVATEVVHVPENGSTLTIPEILALDLEAVAGNKYYVEGTIVRYSDTYKGGLYIQDAEGNEICIYGLQKVYPADEWSDEYIEKFDAMWYEDKPQVGATVKFYGAVGAYNNANQLVDAEFEILAQPAEDPEAYLPEDGSMLTIEEVLALEVTGDTLRQYYIEGTIKEIKSTKYGNMYIEDANGNTLYVYGLYDAFTGARYDKMEDQPQVGEIIYVRSVISYYNGIQLKNARLCECRTAPIELTLDGNTVIEIAAGDADNWEYVYVNAVAYTAEPYAQYTISWDANVTNLMVNYGWVENGGVVSAYDGVLELSFYADDFAALTVTVTLTAYVAPPAPELVAGENAIEVTDAWEGTAVQVSTPGEYTLSLADGETNAYVIIETAYGAEMIEFPYAFTVVDGEAVKFIVMTDNREADTINLVLTMVHDCVDADYDHACDICGEVVSACIDGEYDKRDHACDICGEIISECADANNNHKCDVCYAPLSECVDADNNHKCEVCGNTLSGCTDADADHVCDVCGETVSEHSYVDGVCSVCGTAEPKEEEPEEPSDSTDSTTSEEPTEEDPSILDKVTDMIPDQVKNVIPGCSGVVGGIAGGVAALGLAVVALLKKKEEKDE